MSLESLNERISKLDQGTVSKKPIGEQLREVPQKISTPGHYARKAQAAVSKIIKKAAVLADFITDEDREKSMQVVRDAKLANHRIYDGVLKALVEAPDHKTRLAAVTLERAYDEGLPVARVLSGRVEFESADETLDRLRNSPEAMKAIAGLAGAGMKLTIGGEVVDVEAVVTPAKTDGESCEA